jgi:hypothetical protein
MKSRVSFLTSSFLPAVLLGVSLTAASAADPAPPEGFQALFNGKDLSGWYGWSTKNPTELWQMTPEEDATLKQTQVQTLISLQSIGVDDYTLQKDAIEMGLVKNLAIEDVEAAEKMDDFDVDPENDDFNPENEPEDDPSGEGENDTDSLIKSLTSQPDDDEAEEVAKD